MDWLLDFTALQIPLIAIRHKEQGFIFVWREHRHHTGIRVNTTRRMYSLTSITLFTYSCSLGEERLMIG